MYDYATVTKQNQILSTLETTNSKLELLNSSINTSSFTIMTCILLLFLYLFLKNVLGGR